MDKVRLIHDAAHGTLTIWLDDPKREHICEETADEVVLMKDVEGRVIGIEVLHYRPKDESANISVETVVHTEA